MIAMENVSSDFALRELDYATYFDMLNLDLPDEKSKILSAFVDDGMGYQERRRELQYYKFGRHTFCKKNRGFSFA